MSLRADTARQLAVMLGVLIAAIEDVTPPGMLDIALQLSRFVDTANPTFRRVLP